MNRLRVFTPAAFVLGAVAVGPSAAEAQLPRDPVERARVIAEIMEMNARQLTVFDRRGQTLGVIGVRDLYNQPVFSPDATRVAVIKPDLEKESNDLWIIDVNTARSTRITVSGSREGVSAPAWSPDGTHVAYVGLRGGYYNLYRRQATGEGTEELLHRNSAPLTLTDWSQDGRYLTYFSTDLSGGGAYALPLEATRASASRSRFSVTHPR